jgi:hypothetical protein
MRYLPIHRTTQTQNKRTHTHIHTLSGIRTHDPRVRRRFMPQNARPLWSADVSFTKSYLPKKFETLQITVIRFQRYSPWLAHLTMSYTDWKVQRGHVNKITSWRIKFSCCFPTLQNTAAILFKQGVLGTKCSRTRYLEILVESIVQTSINSAVYFCLLRERTIMRNCNVRSGNNYADSCRLSSLANKSDSVQNGSPMTSLKCLIINPVQSGGRTDDIELRPWYQSRLAGSRDFVTSRKEKKLYNSHLY